MATKVRAYHVLVQSVLLNASGAWNPLTSDICALEAFHVKCQCKILNMATTPMSCPPLQMGLPSASEIVLRNIQTRSTAA